MTYSSLKKFNRDMFNVARAARGFSQSELAKKAGVTQALISKIENGLTTDPTEDTVTSVASVLGFPIEFFYSGERPHGLPAFHYRKRAKVGKRALDKIEADINLRRIHLTKLFQSYDRNCDGEIPVIDIERMQWTPSEAAQHLRGLWLVPRGPIDNMTALMERFGAVVIKIDFGTKHLEALSFRIPNLPPLIFINSKIPGDLYRFVLAHELAHLVLHNHPETDECMEEQADEFAAEFLTPAKEIRPLLAYPSLGKLSRIKPMWKVSIKALIVRASRLKLITPSQYTGLNVNYSKAGYTRGEPFPIVQEDASTLSDAINFHTRQLGYSLEEMAALLMLGKDEFAETYGEKPRLRLIR